MRPLSPDHSTLVKWFDKIKTALWQVLLRLSAQLHEPSGHAAIDATFFDRENASKHYCRRTNYCVQTLKATALVDTETQAILDGHCTTEKRHDTQLGWQVARRNAEDLASLAADRGYDWMRLREKLREEGVGPLIKHREFRPIDHAYIVDERSSATTSPAVHSPQGPERTLISGLFPELSLCTNARDRWASLLPTSDV